MTARRPRVALLVHPPGAGGGIASFAEHLATQLEPQADVTRIAYRRLYPALTTAGRAERTRSGAVARGPVPHLPWTWVGPLVRLVRTRPAVVVVQWWHPLFAPFAVALGVAARIGRARFAVVCHNAMPHERFPFARQLTRAVLRRADVVLTLSEHVQDEVRRLLPTVDARTLSHPPNLTAHQPAPSRRVDNRGQVLFFGHVRPYKGLDDLLDAIALMPVTRRPLLTVAGPFYQPVEDVRAKVAELGIASSVRLMPGYVADDDVPALFADSDVVALPYREASQSGVLRLAAEFGRPVVVTDVAGLAAEVADRGVVVAPGDPVALAAGLAHALSDPPAPPARRGDWQPWVAAVTSLALMQPVLPGQSQNAQPQPEAALR